jgi:hypothetical protein
VFNRVDNCTTKTDVCQYPLTEEVDAAVHNYVVGMWKSRGFFMDSRKTVVISVGLEVFTTVVKKVAIFWDIVPCSPYMN